MQVGVWDASDDFLPIWLQLALVVLFYAAATDCH